MTSLEKLLQKHKACPEATEWAKPYKTLADAWAACDRAEWMCWLLVRMHTKGAAKNSVRLVLCACAETSLKYVPVGEDRPRNAIATARRHALGLATDEELAAAWAAAEDAAWDAAWDAARAAAWAAAEDAAEDAARAAAWAAAWAAARAAAWAAAEDAARAAAEDAAEDAAWDAAEDAAEDAAWDAALRDMANIIRAMIPNPTKPPEPEALWREP